MWLMHPDEAVHRDVPAAADGYPAGVTVDFTATLPRKRMGAVALLSDDQGRVLLVEPIYKDLWVM
jgi:hypothetical protein